MHTASVSLDGAGALRVTLHSTEHAVTGRPTVEEDTLAESEEGPSPIAPEGKELIWGGGAFLVLLVMMRLFLVPAVKKGMTARYGKVRSDLESADATREAAEREVAEYEAQLASVRAEAASRLEAARSQLDGERVDRVAQANTAIAERRSVAATEAEEARETARASVEQAVAGVAARAIELSTGRRPDDGAVRSAVADVMSAGVRR